MFERQELDRWKIPTARQENRVAESNDDVIYRFERILTVDFDYPPLAINL
jgi:hypothetical protein